MRPLEKLYLVDSNVSRCCLGRSRPWVRLARRGASRLRLSRPLSLVCAGARETASYVCKRAFVLFVIFDSTQNLGKRRIKSASSEFETKCPRSTEEAVLTGTLRALRPVQHETHPFAIMITREAYQLLNTLVFQKIACKCAADAGLRHTPPRPPAAAAVAVVAASVALAPSIHP